MKKVQPFFYRGILLWLLSFSAVFVQSSVSKDTILNIGSRLELFVDDYLIDSLASGAELELHHPQPKEIVMVYDEPWEGTGSG